MIDRIHHVAILVHSADEALKFYRDVMGLTVTADSVMTEQGIRGVLLSMGENEIEILEPVVPDTGVSRYLASKGETLHHICFRTDDIDAELARLKSLDVTLVDQEPRDGLAGRIAFIHPKAMHGVLVELIEAGKIAPVIDRRYPLDEVADALRYLKAGRARGKIVITM